MADELKFTRRIELEEWLKDKPVEWAQVIALRTAMRVLPMVRRVYQSGNLEDNDKDTLILSTFRACFISLAILKYPDMDLTACAANIADTADLVDVAFATYVGFSAEALSASSATSAIFAASAKDAAANAATAATFSGEAAFAVRAPLDMWNAVSTDSNWLLAQVGKASEQARHLAETRLWPDGEPGWMSKERSILTHALMELSEHHFVWINWYLRIIMGKPFFDLSAAREKELTLKIVQQTNKFWEQDFVRVSEDISKWLEKARIEDAD